MTWEAVMNIKLGSGQYYGVTKSRGVIPGFRLMESAYAPGVRVPKHSHECPCFSLMLQGSMAERYRSRILESRAQTVGFNAAEEPHSNTISRIGARFFILEIGQDLTKRAKQYSSRFNESAVFQCGELSLLGLKLYRESIHLDQLSALAIEGLALEMIATLCRTEIAGSGKRPPSWLIEARDIIHAHFTEPLCVSSIANIVGVHSVHLARTFRKHYRTSIGEYVRGLRIESARRDICSSDLPLADIAMKSGFCDQGHLSRVFKRFTGMSPSKYRSFFR